MNCLDAIKFVVVQHGFSKDGFSLAFREVGHVANPWTCIRHNDTMVCMDVVDRVLGQETGLSSQDLLSLLEVTDGSTVITSFILDPLADKYYYSSNFLKPIVVSRS